jgi:hypothetical protein
MNHRFGDGAWPQGDSEERARATLQVPAKRRRSPEAAVAVVAQTQGLDAQVIRKGPPGGAKDARARRRRPAPKWTLSGGSAREAWSLDYVPGNATLEVKHTRHDTLAAFNRLHKGVGGGIGWTILADSFALCMLLLGVSGLWMWARGRTAKDVVASVLAASVGVLLLVLVPALL